MYLKIKSFNNGKPILFGQNSTRTPFGVTMTDADVLPNSAGKKLIPEGSFIVATGNKIRFLPRAKVKTAITTSNSTLTLKAPCASFAVGDVLYGQAGYAEVVLTGTATTGDVVTISIDDINYSTTAPASATLANTAAQFVTDNATALLALGITVAQKGSTGSLIIRATDAHKIATHSSNGALQAVVLTTEPGYLGDAVIPVGTILAIGTANADGERVITLAANAAYNLPVNSNVGVKVTEFLGIFPEPVDFTDTPSDHLAPVCEADGVYEQNLPYVDKQLKRIFSDLRIYKRFYKNV